MKIKALIEVEIKVPKNWDSKEDQSNPLLESICEEIKKSKYVTSCNYSFYKIQSKLK